MTDFLSIDDLFTAGLGFDLAGDAYLFVKRVFGVDSVPPIYQGEAQPPPEAFGKGPSGEPNARKTASHHASSQKCDGKP